MNNSRTAFIASIFLLGLVQKNSAWTPLSTSETAITKASSSISRRSALTTAANAAAFVLTTAPSTTNAVEDTPKQYAFEKRDRDGNKNAVIREDYWYSTGITPPRQLNSPLVLDDPKWNSFGACETNGGDAAATNSCTYISLKQRQPAYSKYAFSITLGATEFQYLRNALQDQDWSKAASYVFANSDKNQLPPPSIDALTKMVLFASLMLSSPNFSGVSRELLVARFYANEFKYAILQVQDAIAAKDQARALAAWDFGKDSYNSYTQVVNRQIVPKVGDPLPLIVQ